ncbi:hypothetical protein M446_1502 [Methylobacterium sp. 4-46]|uniref:PGN_0703 family putative restriction endonuclease n=1 Tax=unclassified Methylobacterium TaxID=2615210 RepID=UPI000152CD29|nr:MULTISPECIES: hypothetical protein [Methylobacterium]ACA16007.1 hypothetical protein M446_1502 [Methylobacterium sp. 4-46]WFT81721.1 hypothetical protein QA634_07615 [Methylobacterium nodulans]
MDHRFSSEDAAPESAFVRPLTRAPLIPEALLRQHACFILTDTRFRAAARLRQSLWRESVLGLPAGLHCTGGSRAVVPALLGSTLRPADAANGLNFISSTVHQFVRRSLVLREEGALVHYDRLHRNLLSSEALTYNLFAPLALDLDLATAVFRQLLPAFVTRVTGIRFETSPGRHDPRYLNDGTAFDAALTVITPEGERATVFIEVKYGEGCTGAAATHRPRYDEASREAALHHDPDSPALRSTLLEQFWRLHLLAQLAVRHGVTPRAHLLVLAPQLNRRVSAATSIYTTQLTDPGGSSPATTGFSALTLESFVSALAQAGGGAEAGYLWHRYLDLRPVLDLVLAEPSTPDRDPPPAGAPVALLPPPSSATPVADAVAAPVATSSRGQARPARRPRRRPTESVTAPSSSTAAVRLARRPKDKAPVGALRTSARSPAPRRPAPEVR